MDSDEIDETTDIRQHAIFFQINGNVSLPVKELTTSTYVRLKHNDDAAYEYVMQQIDAGNCNLSGTKIECLYRSIDDVDYTPVNIPSQHSASSITNIEANTSVSCSSVKDIGESQVTPVKLVKNLVCNSNSAPSKQPSLVWKHFIKQQNFTAQCKFCDKIFKHAGNTTNLMQHLTRKHELFCKNLNENNRKRKSSDNDASKQIKLQSQDKLSRIDEALERANSFKSGGKQAERITNAILYMVAVDQLPLSTVENDGFKFLMKTATPLYAVPSRKKITHLIETRYEILKQTIKANLQKVSSYTLTCDTWTDVSMQSYLGVTVHYQSENLKMHSGCLGVFPLYKSHTAEYIADSLRSVITDFKLDIAKITAIVSNSAPNMKKAVADIVGKQKQLVCFAHVVSHLVPDALSTMPTAKDIITKIKNIVGLTRRSIVASDELKRLQIRDGKSKGTALKFIQDCPTRWNSTLYMLDRFLQLEEYIYAVISKCPNAPDMLTREEIHILKDLVSLMKPVENVITDISGDKYSTCSMIIPIIHCMEASIRNLNVSTKLGEQFKQNILTEIENRFKNFELNTILAISTLLDPRFKKLHFQSALAASSAIFKINKLVKGKVENLESTKVQVSDKSSKKTQSVWDFHDYLVVKNKDLMETNDETLCIELKHYLQAPVVPRQTDPFKHWKTLENTFPSLYQLAVKYCSAVATSVSSERIFSDAGNIKSDDRSRLTGEHLNQLVFLGSLSLEEWGLI